jgi:hypothetical protein
MAYRIWLSLQARDTLQSMRNDSPEIYQRIQEELEALSIERENWQTGAPSRIEGFRVGKWQVYYRVLPKLQSIDVVAIAGLP